MVTCVLMKCLAAAISSTVTTQGWDSSLLVDRTFATWLHAMKTLYYQSITNVHKYFLRYRGGGGAGLLIVLYNVFRYRLAFFKL